MEAQLLTQRRMALLEAHGVENSHAIVTSLEKPERPVLSYALGMIENESHGRNVFGSEGAYAAVYEQVVTEDRAMIYWKRSLTEGQNGIGPTQITDRDLQEEARKLGGLHSALATCDVGFHFLHGLILEHGLKGAYGNYNGGPDWEAVPAAVAYSNRAMEYRREWQFRLAAAGLA